MTEVAPGIHRIESVLGPRPFSQYLLAGDRRLLVDTGIVSTPADVILPFFKQIGLAPEQLDYVLLSHADVDHYGGNEAIKAWSPGAVFCAHERDCTWIESQAKVLEERYGWYAEHGPEADYDESAKAFLKTGFGKDVPVDLRLNGGERFRIGPKLTVDVLSLPGHSDGHIGLWDPVSRSAIVIDAVLGAGLLNMDGVVIHPPPYFDPAAYLATIMALKALKPDLLLTAHYAPMRGREVIDFLELSADFIQRTRNAVTIATRRARQVTLAELLADVGPELGPFTSFPNELCGPLRAHLRELVAEGRIEEMPNTKPPTWRWVG